MGLRRSTRRLAVRGLVVWLGSIVAAVATLMISDKVRKILRGRNIPLLPPAESVAHQLNDVGTATTYTYGEVLFDDMLDAIENAQHRILFETYIIKGDATGQRFKDALIEAAERGVDVYVIYDGFANLVVKPSFLRFPSPVKVLRYPVFSTGWQFFNPRRYGRDHRKIMVVDDTVGFVGGYNVGAAYAAEWRDTHLKVEGQAVWDLDNAFVDFWNLFPKSVPSITQFNDSTWQSTVRAHRNVPRQLMFPIRGMYLEAIDRAQKSIDITAAYFIPDRDILNALLVASRDRGVKVRILVPRISNHVVTDWLSRGFYGRLMEAGVEIHRYTDHMVHAKTATIDGEWTTIGTANIDRLSLMGNYEINLEILDRGLAAGMTEIFETDCESAERLDLAEWNQRHTIARIYELLLKPLRPLL